MVEALLKTFPLSIRVLWGSSAEEQRFYGRKSARDDVWAEITRRGHRGGKGQRVTNNNIAEKPLLIANQERFAEFEPPNELKWTVLMSQPTRKHSTVHSFGHTINSRDMRNFSTQERRSYSHSHTPSHTPCTTSAATLVVLYFFLISPLRTRWNNIIR